ncbi:transglycosylase SLT domain-containing protein [Oceanobacter sp. 5_MG-2023]|uniref:transglycosylase SLT domain-containing protein n=1 Tax=Oceanobacter sp. 5_MG-2023 TaxID=3062645 RepID=UPI0026E18781|nr:transglycosylase SLT domain-containing protein [Oceanobacter sp. 5_MG-2023]MDO6681543.1 transglycosylase SLT domain-containing protein [Oceanobacter sp. 5_MG-2023]
MLYSIGAVAEQGTDTIPTPEAEAAARAQFVEVEQQLDTVPYEAVADLIEPLQGYSLYPYLQYQVYQRFPEHLTQAEVSRFLDSYPQFPRRIYLQNTWLKQLAKEERWQEWLTAYQRLPRKGAAYQCDLAMAYLQTDQQEQGLALTDSLWMVAKSQPAACDPLFAQWSQYGNPTAGMAAKRYWLAAQAGNMRLARYLHRFMDADANALASRYETLSSHPNQALTADLSVFPEPAQRRLLEQYFQPLARRSAETAAQQWLKYRATLPEASSLIAPLDVYIGKWLTYSQTDTATALLAGLDYDYQYPELTEYRLRRALGAEIIDWTGVLTLIDTLPADLQASDRWQYWYANAVQNQPGDSAAAEMQTVEQTWNQLAQSRSFYGFLAATHQQLPFNLNNQPFSVNTDVLTEIQNVPAIQRAKEWLALERNKDAEREWLAARASLAPVKRQHMVALSLDWGWHHRAIMDAIRQRQWNYLEARFPVLFTDLFEIQARKNEIDVTWATAIARQESAFKPAAQSPVGARGLMQLMPATAKTTAKKHGVPLAAAEQLFQPETNIALGTAYLAEMFQRFDGNRAYASAAYNAGPHRVERWLEERGHLPLDVWIETIPYAETRQYVQNVLAFRVIYAQRAGQEVAMFSPDEQVMLAYQPQAEAVDIDTPN